MAAKPPIMQDIRTGNPARIGVLTTEIVTRKEQDILADGELTIGQLIDEHLHQMSDDGCEVRNVGFTFSEEMWLEYRTMFAPRPTPHVEDPWAEDATPAKPGKRY